MLDVKTGKKIFILAALLVMQAKTVDALQLRVVSDQGQPISKIAVGSPCMVELTLPASVTVQAKAVIAGIDPHDIMREQETTQVSIVNGVTTRQRTISYLVSFAQMGTVTVGPAHLQTTAGELVSPPTTIEVVDPATTRGHSKKFVFAELELHKQSAFVHEAVPYTIHFYYTDDAVQQVNIEDWSVPHARQIAFDTIKRGTTSVRGIDCHYAAWSGVIYPRTSGKLQIPSVHFAYTEPVLSSHLHHQWAQFMQMFAPVSVHKQIRSNAASLLVKELPPLSEHVTGVGSLSEVALSCSTDTVAQGESVVCTVTFEGNFDAEAFKVPPLQVPKSVRVYESKVSVEGKYPRFTATYEYIVQGLEAGATEIPAQRYLFFDARTATYVAAVTTAYPLYIMPTAQPTEIPQVAEPEPTIVATAPEITTAPPISSHVPMPLWLYIVLLVIPVLWVLLQQYIYRLHEHMQLLWLRRRAFRLMRRELHHAVEQNDAYAFLSAWRSFLTQVLPQSAWHEDPSGASYLQSLGASETEVASLRDVWHEVTARAFFASDAQKLRDLLQCALHSSALLRKKMRDRGAL